REPSASCRARLPAYALPSSSVQRQREVKRGSLALTALRPDATTVELDELLADREAEPGAPRAPRDRIVQLLERFEQAREILRADADPGVRHLHAHEIGRASCRERV